MPRRPMAATPEPLGGSNPVQSRVFEKCVIAIIDL